jgi:CubicO group peptidase (beta-lactamase class C family)
LFKDNHMKFHKKSFTVIVLISLLLTLCGGLIPAQAQDGTTYTDPQGRFSAPIPAGWTDESTEDYGRFSHPDGITVSLLAVEAADLDEGLQTALLAVHPDFSGKSMQTNDIPLPNGSWTQQVYLRPGGAIWAAVGQHVDGVAYVLVYELASAEVMNSAAGGKANSLLLGFAIGAPIQLAGIKPQALTEAQISELDAYITGQFAQSNIPGAAVAVVQNGEVIYSRGFGVRALGDETPVDSQTLFMIGSTTKSMTTLSMATLVDEGVFDWDTPVLDLYPDFALSDPGAAAQIRLRDTVNMSSGLPRYDMVLFVTNPTPEALLASLAEIPMVAQPGEQFNYSNQMVAAGGFIMALAAGATYGDNVLATYQNLVQTRVFDPLGMTSSTLDFERAITSDNHALPHTTDLESGEVMGIPVDFERFVIPDSPAGAVWSNVDDMAKYLSMQIAQGVAPDGTRVVSAENLLITQSPEMSIGGPVSYGIGWMIGDFYGQKFVEHGGGTMGFVCDFSFLPESGLGVVVLINRAEGEIFGAAVRQYVYELAFGLDHRFNPSYTTTVEQMRGSIQLAALDSAQVEPYLGRYEHDAEIMLDAAGSPILRTLFGDVPLKALVGSEAWITSGPLGGLTLTFAQDDAGQISLTLALLIDPTSTYTLQRIAAE